MFLTETEKFSLQEATLPQGFELVKDGKVKEGDIRWNLVQDCWNLSDPTTSPKHNLIIGDNVRSCAGICRKINP